jgi:hypothetical protein
VVQENLKIFGVAESGYGKTAREQGAGSREKEF